ARTFTECGFRVLATGRTCEAIQTAGIPVTKALKNYEGRPNVQDLITNGEIQLIINTPIGKGADHDDSYLRKSAIKARIPYITTMAAAVAAAEGIRQVRETPAANAEILSLQEWHELL
ncbi:MAG: carbamoyl phosphate synthase large subunit, partial [Butyrivibrio sp.]|nr:carbamoyl phosphate synthase large subunit [Butyrivibrio sp.]